MTDLMKEVSSEPCGHCGNPIGTTHVNLSRNTERIVESDSAFEGEVESGEVLESYCMECGPNVARKKLAALGVVHQEMTEDYSRACLCAVCGTTNVDLHEWHTTFVIATDQFDGECFNTLEETVVAAVCAGCKTSCLSSDFTS